MTYNQDFVERLNEYSDSYFESKFKNIVPDDTIYQLRSLKDVLLKILANINLGDKIPDWFFKSMDYYVENYISLAKGDEINNRINQSQKDEYVFSLHNFIQKLNYATDSNGKSIKYMPQPILQMYSDLHSFTKISDVPRKSFEEFNSKFNDLSEKLETTLSKNNEEFIALKTEQESSIALINKEVGKLGVKDYADIFENQAKEHSQSIFTKNGNLKFKISFSKAQAWIILAMSLLVLIVFAFTQLDIIFLIKPTDTFTPYVIVHIIGRFLLISLVIFIISFAFKQFRVNMHLYTLNKHRANTLKSFEYLSRAPDKLAPESYNAILMEVAKAIYESGQTGYIAASDTNSDIPSIIDMSKVITQPK